MAFCHADRDGRIAFQPSFEPGLPVFGAPGEVRGTVRLVGPADQRGQSFDLWLGLWRPGDSRPGARMLPDRGAGDRRTKLGQLAVATNGQLTFTPDR